MQYRNMAKKGPQRSASMKLHEVRPEVAAAFASIGDVARRGLLGHAAALPLSWMPNLGPCTQDVGTGESRTNRSISIFALLWLAQAEEQLHTACTGGGL